MSKNIELRKRLGSLILQIQEEIKKADCDDKYLSCSVFNDSERGNTAVIWNTPNAPTDKRFDFYIDLSEVEDEE